MQHAWREFEVTGARPIPFHEALRFGRRSEADAAVAARARRPVALGPAFPPDASARIVRPARSATTSGKARTKDWLLRFERRTPPFVEPLMGWTGGGDTLTQDDIRH
jgi:hypothetical protein